MINLDEIKAAIEALPKNDLIHLKQWFSEKDWEEWDLQIENDSILGKLDFLAEEAVVEKKRGNLGKL
ncbi:MAG: hypothetical protein ACE5I1_22825 [bacterium]